MKNKIIYSTILIFFLCFYSCNSEESQRKEQNEIDKNYTECDSFFKEYEDWTDEFVTLCKLSDAKPENIELKTQKKKMGSTLSQWGLKWKSLTNCNKDSINIKRYETTTGLITDVMETSNY